MIAAYPLHWPINRARIQPSDLVSSRTTVSLAVARDHLIKQMELIGIANYIISSNALLRKDGLPMGKQPKIADPGVGVWIWNNNPLGWVCVSCDGFDSIAGNMRAIGLSLGEMRGFSGRLNLSLPSLLIGLFWVGVGGGAQEQQRQQEPPPPPPEPEPEPTARSKRDPGDWRSVLKLGKIITWDQVVTSYRKLRKELHPDKPTGSTEAFQELGMAYDAAKKHFKFKD